MRNKKVAHIAALTFAIAVALIIATPGCYYDGSQAQIDDLRAELIDKIWSGKEMPTAGITSMSKVASPLPAPQPANLLKVDRAIVRMKKVESVSYIFYPNNTNHKLVIYGFGHRCEPSIWTVDNYVPTIRALVEQGYTVASVVMIGCPKKRLTSAHNKYSGKTTPLLNPLKYFVEPYIRLMNHFEHQFIDVYMTGFSGGGWATHVVSAIDPRISKSVAIAGAFPLAMSDKEWPGKRDFEEKLPGLDVDYLDLFVMATDKGRRQLQILNMNDSCCFPGWQYKQNPYGPGISQKTDGRWSIIIDKTNSHTVSRHAVNVLLRFFSEPLAEHINREPESPTQRR